MHFFKAKILKRLVTSNILSTSCQLYVDQSSFLSTLNRIDHWSVEIRKDLTGILEELLKPEFQSKVLPFKAKITKFLQLLRSKISIHEQEKKELIQLLFQVLLRISKPLRSLSFFRWHQFVEWEVSIPIELKNLIEDYLLERPVNFNSENNSWVFYAKKENEPFAVKVVESTSTEILMLNRIQQHPHIIQLCEFVIFQSIHVMVFPWFNHTGENMPANAQTIQTCFQHLILAIEFCHSKGILHLDIKPSNTLLDLSSDTPKLFLADFGFSLPLYEAKKCPGLTFVGTSNYSAPEILCCKGGYVEADIWSAGVTLAYWIYGRNIFLLSIKNFDFSSFPSIIPNSNRLKQLIPHILVVDPKKRPTTKQLIQFFS